jgi:hypothetical protein
MVTPGRREGMDGRDYRPHPGALGCGRPATAGSYDGGTASPRRDAVDAWATRGTTPGAEPRRTSATAKASTAAVSRRDDVVGATWHSVSSSAATAQSRPMPALYETLPDVGEELGRWDPLTPQELSAVLAVLDTPWWLAGGWAIDLHVGRQSRLHEDIDVLVLRPHHVQVRAALADWDLHAADPPGTLRPWPVGEVLPGAVHDVWCRRAPGEPWAFQLMIDDVAGDDWVFRRDDRVRRPLTTIAGPASTPELRLLAPEIQLLYKSRGLRPKDQADCDTVLPVLSQAQRGWLRDALATSAPGHPWLAVL